MSRNLSSTAEAILLRNVAERLPRVLAINLAAAICTLIAFWGHVASITLISWFIAMAVALATRFKAWWDFRKLDGRSPDRPSWTRRFAISSGANGAAWGLASILFYDPQLVAVQVFLPFVLAGLSGASLVGLSGCMPAFVAFFVSLTSPYAVRLAIEGDQLHLTMAAGLIIYMISIGVLGRSVNSYLRASAQLAAEKEQLVSAIREKSDQLRETSSQLQATFEHINQGVGVFGSDGQLLICNGRYRELHGLSEESDCRRTNETQLVDVDPTITNAWETRAGEPRQRALHSRYEQPGTDSRTLEIEESRMPNGGFVRTSTDITERKRAEARTLHLAQHDALTGLPNRLLFQSRLEEAFSTARQRNEGIAILFLDLDQFKEINDTLGHAGGDLLLQQAAARFKDCIRESDTLARLGGDEFAIIQSGPQRRRGATALARRIGVAFEQPFEIGSRNVHVRTCIGIALSNEHTPAAADELLQNADVALYRAKAEARGSYRVFDEQMRTQARLRQKVERDLRLALSDAGFELHYQPQLDLRTNRVTGVEALLRWPHARRGMVSPREFVPLAEETGLIVAIGRWVLTTACAQAMLWPSLKIAVNVSPIELRQPDMTLAVKDVLCATGLPPSRLELEVPEDVLLHDDGLAMNTLRQLSDIGVRLALDDFGRGRSNLHHLLSFPFSKVKIDRSRVDEIDRVPEARTVLRAFIALARSAGIRINAEGVETPTQAEILHDEGCEEIQGYYFRRPMLAKDVPPLLLDKEVKVA